MIGLAPTRLVWICVRLYATNPRGWLTDLRTLVTADVVRRALEHMVGQQVLVALTVPEDAEVDRSALESGLSSLWIGAPIGVASDEVEAIHLLGGPIDVLVEPTARAQLGQPIDVSLPTGSPLRIEVGPAQADKEGSEQTGRWWALPWSAQSDALASRLLVLSCHHAHPVRFGEAELDLAEATLRRWRRDVAAWAHGPAAILPADLVHQARDMFADDLDTPAVLSLLRRVEHDPDLAVGAKFELFVDLDRILALDLVRDMFASAAPG